MTPVHTYYMLIRHSRVRSTKGMPQNQGKLRHLLALLGQLQESSLARVGLHKLRNPLQDALVLLRHDSLVVALDVVGRSARNYAGTWDRGAIVGGHAIEVLLLCGSGGDSGGLGLRLMGLQLALLVNYMVSLVLLLVVLRPVTRVLLLVLVDVLHLRAMGVRDRGSCCCCGVICCAIESVVGSAFEWKEIAYRGREGDGRGVLGGRAK